MPGSNLTGSILETEIRSQPDVLRARDSGAEAAAAAVELIRGAGSDHLLMAARGSSDNAARFGQYLLGREAGILVSLSAPALFDDQDGAPNLGHAAVVGVSQSGQSPDVVSVLAAGRRQGRPTVAITNDASSPLASLADVVLALGSGPEKAVAATKTYLTSLVCLVELANAWAPDPERQRRLAGLPDVLDQVIEDTFAAAARLETLAQSPSMSVIGRALGFSAAMETALKVREVTGILTEGWSPPDLLHGPVAALRHQSAICVLGTPDYDRVYWRSVLESVAGRARVLMVVSADPELCQQADLSVALPANLPPWVASAAAVVVGQITALVVGRALGVDLDHPEGLSKVTLTR